MEGIFGGVENGPVGICTFFLNRGCRNRYFTYDWPSESLFQGGGGSESTFYSYGNCGSTSSLI